MPAPQPCEEPHGPRSVSYRRILRPTAAAPALLSGNAGKVVRPRVFAHGPIGANLFVAVTDQVAESF